MQGKLFQAVEIAARSNNIIVVFCALTRCKLPVPLHAFVMLAFTLAASLVTQESALFNDHET